jgi:ABC-type branched-subunit amino acid transport system substrate-binding protein
VDHRRRTIRALGAIVACLLVITACGARLDEDQKALATSGAGTGAGNGTGTGSDTGGAATDAGTGDAGTTDPGAVAGDPGAVASDPGAAGADPGAADPGAAPAAGAGACTSSGKASDVGVTAKEITIGNVSTISGPIPDFGRTGVNGVKAYVNFINSSGGICGRKVKLLTADDRLDAGTNKSETDKMKDKAFAMVGGTTVVDDGGAASLKGTNIPDLGLAIAEARIALPNNFSPNPIDPTADTNGAAKMFKYMKDTYGVSNGAVIWAAQAASRTSGKKYIQDMAQAGIKVDANHQFEVGVTETNYSAQVSKMKNDKVDIVITTLEVNGMSKLAQAFGQAGYFPKVPFYGAQAYGKKFLQLAGRNAEGTKLGLAYNVLEVADAVPAIKNFVTWYQRTNPGADVDFFAIESWLAADMWARATKEVGGDPTRDKVLKQLGTYTSYEADGFLGKINPAGKKPAACYVIVEVQGGAWKKTNPQGPGFAC